MKHNTRQQAQLRPLARYEEHHTTWQPIRWMPQTDCTSTQREAPQHTEHISLGSLPRLVAFDRVPLFPSSQHPKQLWPGSCPHFIRPEQHCPPTPLANHTRYYRARATRNARASIYRKCYKLRVNPTGMLLCRIWWNDQLTYTEKTEGLQ